MLSLRDSQALVLLVKQLKNEIISLKKRITILENTPAQITYGGQRTTSFTQLTDMIANAQAPQFLLLDGSRAMTGQLVSTVTSPTAPFSVTSTKVCTNLNADRLDNVHRTSFVRRLYMMGALFKTGDVTIGTSEDTVFEKYESVASTVVNYYVPSFSATYRWTDLDGGNPTCRVRIDFGIFNWDTFDYDWYEKNYIEFEGVDLFRHPVALVRAFVDASDISQYGDGVSDMDIGFRIRAYTSAGTVVFNNISFSGVYGQAYAT